MKHQVGDQYSSKTNESSQMNLSTTPPPKEPGIPSRPSFNLQGPSPRSYPSLMDLPLELRTMIWNYVLVLNEDQIEISPPCKFKKGSAESEPIRRNHVLAILRTSRIIYQETMQTFYRHNTFYFSFSHYLEEFLNYGNPKSRQFIRSIRLQVVVWNPVQAFKTLLQCEQLRHLQLCTYGGESEGKKWHERHSVRSSGMEELLKLRGLMSVKVSRFATRKAELHDPTDLLEYGRLRTALEVLKQPKLLQAQAANSSSRQQIKVDPEEAMNESNE